MQEKAAVGADLYIEDSPTNVEQLRDEKLDTIVFTNSTNEYKRPLTIGFRRIFDPLATPAGLALSA